MTDNRSYLICVTNLYMCRYIFLGSPWPCWLNNDLKHYKQLEALDGQEMNDMINENLKDVHGTTIRLDKKNGNDATIH